VDPYPYSKFGSGSRPGTQKQWIKNGSSTLPLKLTRQLVQELAILQRTANSTPNSICAIFSLVERWATMGWIPLEITSKGGLRLKKYLSFLTVGNSGENALRRQNYRLGSGCSAVEISVIVYLIVLFFKCLQCSELFRSQRNANSSTSKRISFDGQIELIAS